MGNKWTITAMMMMIIREYANLGFGVPRDVNYRTKGTGGASEVPEDKARATDGIVPLQSGTNKLASQAGMTGIGMPRIVDGQTLALLSSTLPLSH